MKKWWNDRIIRVGMGWGLQDWDQIQQLKIPEHEKRRIWTETKQAFRKLNAKTIVNDLKAAGVEVCYFHAKSLTGNIWFQSKIGQPYSLLGKRDFFGELVAECRKNDIVPVGMFQVTVDRRHALFHPDWCIVGADGKTSSYLCIHNPAWRKYILGIIREVATQYDVGAICLDELRLGSAHTVMPGCYCCHCQALFRASFQCSIPKEDWDNTLWKNFVEWRYSQVHQFLQEVRAILQAVNPQLLLTLVSYVSSHNDYTSGQRIAQVGEVLDYLNLDIQRSVFISETAKRFRSFSQKRPEIWTSGILQLGNGPRSGGDALCVRPPVEYLTDALAVVANGCAINMDTYQPVAKGQRHYFGDGLRKMMTEIASAVRKRKPWLIGDLQPVRYAALLYSEQTRDYYGSAQGNFEFYNNEFRGVYNVLWQKHVPCEIIGEKQLVDGTLSNYHLLIMPNAACLSDAEVLAVVDFVKKGGGLVANYQSSLRNHRGELRKDFGLAKLFGVHYQGGVENDFDFSLSKIWGNYDGIRIAARHPIVCNTTLAGKEFMLPTPVLKVVPRGGQVLARIIYKPDVSVNVSGVPIAMPETHNVGIIANRYGRGKVVWFNSKIGSLCDINGHPYVRQMLFDAVRWVGGDLPLKLNAPFFVEAIAFRDDQKCRLIMHLLNHQACPTTVADESRVARRHDAKEWVKAENISVSIKLKILGRNITHVYLAPEKQMLEYTIRDDSLFVTVDQVDLHRMVVIEWRKRK